jgi:hypothetical protein
MILLDIKKCLVVLMIIFIVIPIKAKSETSETVARELVIRILGPGGNPIHGAVVIVKVPDIAFREERTTNNKGEIKIEEISGEKVKIQVISEGRPTFGKTYLLKKEKEVIEIKLPAKPEEEE